MHRLRCRCGALTGQILAGSTNNRLRCYCTDCQAAARFFGPDRRVMDAQGGTEIVQVARSRLQIDKGLKHLACLRLKPQGLLRWYAACCQTPIGNTLDKPGFSMVGLVHTVLDESALDRDFGPVTAEVNAETALGHPPPRTHGMPGVIAKVMVMVAGDLLRGRHRRSPLFTDTGAPVVTPRVLTGDELSALKQLH